MPSILMINPGPTYDIQAAFSERLSRLSKMGYDGILLTSGPTDSVEKIASFAVHRLTRDRGKGWLFYNTVRFLVGPCRRMDWGGGTGPDLVCTYDPLRSGLLGCFSKRIFGAKLIVEVNGDYTNDANYADIKNRLFARFKRWIYVWVERFVIARADGIKLLYETQLEELKLDIRGTPVGVFPNRIQIEQFSNLGDNDTVLSVGFPWQVKGMDLTISAFRKIEDRFPNCKLHILGWYQDSEYLRELIGDSRQIELRPPVKHSQIAEIIGRCSVFVLASRTESMGRVLVESMAAGKPRIATNVGGIPTVIEHGVDGLLVEAENTDELSVALARLLSDPELRERMGAAAAERAKREFSAELYYKNLDALFKKVLDKAN